MGQGKVKHFEAGFGRKGFKAGVNGDMGGLQSVSMSPGVFDIACGDAGYASEASKKCPGACPGTVGLASYRPAILRPAWKACLARS